MSNTVTCPAEPLPLGSSETVAPDPGRLMIALRQIGYSLEQALSDLIDNALSAGAANVLIRFLWSDERIVGVAVIDDGDGMDADQLRNAMRFGSAERVDLTSLGKFGLGLKLSSFSHSRKLTVVSRRGGLTVGRRWTLEGIRRHWDCETFEERQAEALIDAPWSPIDLRTSGTVVLWNDIDKLPVSSRGLRYTLNALHRRLELHLGLHFHRFIQHGVLSIRIDQQEQGEQEHQIRATVPALDPFGYEGAPPEGYPRTFLMRLAGVGEIPLDCHIWPPNSDQPEYRLGNRAAARQGFYFYRNHRLIQAGGWNGLVQNEAEPHSSLTRVRVDLPPSFDDSFSLNVQKSSMIAPPGFVEAAADATDRDGVSFDSYRQTAQNVYRSKDTKAAMRRTPIPCTGLPDVVVRQFEPESASLGETRPIDLRWETLDLQEVFRVDRENGRLLLNRHYRDRILAGLSPARDDVPLFKALLFCLIGPDFQTGQPSERRRRELARINRILVAASALEQG